MRTLVLAWLLLLLAACTTSPSFQERQMNADTLGAAKGWQAIRVSAGNFDLLAYIPSKIVPAVTLSIYLEGDGFAWLNGSTPASDPTPLDPLALRLALVQPRGNAAYLARPCQYVNAVHTRCDQRFWTNQRFASETVEAAGIAVDALKQRFGARKIILVGYSGGGNIAAILASRREDVTRLITVAANLDHQAWTSHHRVSSLTGSLSAADHADHLANIPQTHFVGAKDRVIPPKLALRWPQQIRGADNSNLIIIADMEHSCCWADMWPALWAHQSNIVSGL